MVAQIWAVADPARPTLITTLSGPSKAIGQLAFSPDGTRLAACGTDGQTYLWDTTHPDTISTAGQPISQTPAWANTLAFSPDGSKVAVGSSDGGLGARL